MATIGEASAQLSLRRSCKGEFVEVRGLSGQTVWDGEIHVLVMATC